MQNPDEYFRFYTDLGHKYWGYFQVVSAAVLGFCWTALGKKDATGEFGESHGLVLLCLIVAFLAFSVVNRKLLIEANAAVNDAWNVMKKRDGASTIEAMAPVPSANVFLLHSVLTVLVVVGLGASDPAAKQVIISVTGIIYGLGFLSGVAFVVLAAAVSVAVSWVLQRRFF